MPIESGGCPSTTGSGSDYGSGASGAGTCFEPYTQECNSTEIHCDAGYDSDFCWYGNYCINQVNEWDGCPAPIGGSELNSGEDICAHMTYTEECSDSQISCDSGYSNEGCWFGNYCIDTINSWDNCPGMCSTPCNWETENWCDMGIDANGCWMGNWCQDMSLGECPQVTMVSKRGTMEKMRALAAKAKAIGN